MTDPVPAGVEAAGAPVGKGAVTPGAAELCGASGVAVPGTKLGPPPGAPVAPAAAEDAVKVVNCTAGTVAVMTPDWPVTVMVVAGIEAGMEAEGMPLGTPVTTPGLAEM